MISPFYLHYVFNGTLDHKIRVFDRVVEIFSLGAAINICLSHDLQTAEEKLILIFLLDLIMKAMKNL